MVEPETEGVLDANRSGMDAPLPVIEGYRDLEHLNSGGSSIIHSAHDLRHNRKVAIKVLTAQSLDATLQQSFKRELKAMELLSDHPHILPMLDSGLTSTGMPFIVMPLFTDGSYSDRLKEEGNLSWVETVDVGIRIGSALQAAHDRNVLHRDVKPSNIFVGHYRADPVLGDFGISTVLGEDVTTTVAVAYTLTYVAPEVLNGKRQTRQSDIYSLGLTLRQFLTGRPAFSAETSAALIAQILGYPPMPLMLDIPSELVDLLDSMVRKDPADRPDSAGEVVEQLRSIQQNRSAAFVDVDKPIDRSASDREFHERTTSGNDDATERIAVPVATRPFFAQTTMAPPQLRLVDPVRLASDYGSVNAIEFSPDNSKLVSANDNGSIVFWDINNGDVVRKVEGHSDLINAVAHSVEGDLISTASDDTTIVLWDAETGREQHRLAGHTDNVNSVAFSPDGATLASASFDGSVMLWNVDDGTHRQTLGDMLDLNSVHSVVYRADGFALATGSFDGSLILWDAETGQKQLTIEDHTDWVTSVAFSPDGNMLASGSIDGSAIMRDAITGEKFYELQPASSKVKSVAFSPDGRRLATAGTAGLELWDVASGRKQNVPTGDVVDGGASLVTFGHDGTKLATLDASESLTIWSVA